MFELTVILKNDESTYKEKFLCYDPVNIDPLDEGLQSYVALAKENFKKIPTDITIKISMHIQ